jgi:N-acetylmuramoyl-L-alanine amidase
MTYNRIVISSGHGKHVRGASGIIDEVDEARRVVNEVTRMLKAIGVAVTEFHDNTSHSQNENLNTIVDFHNSQSRDLDISVHFNAYEQVSKPMGVEVLYVTQSSLAGKVSSAIASCGFVNRGPKKRTDLFFLNNTTKPAILIETCFVDSEADTHIYNQYFMAICNAITSVLGEGEGDITQPPPPGETHNLVGTVSRFGGPNDMGVSEDEGLAFIYEVEDAPHLFLPYQPEDTTGLARRLNPFIHYIACRWDYEDTSKDMLLREMALVRATKTGIALKAFPADWGPHVDTGRIADISPGLMMDLGIETDDEVEVIFPHRENL